MGPVARSAWMVSAHFRRTFDALLAHFDRKTRGFSADFPLISRTSCNPFWRTFGAVLTHFGAPIAAKRGAF